MTQKLVKLKRKILSKKYITAKEFNKLTVETFKVRLKQADLAAKADINDFVEKTNFDDN